ncbi:MAG: hypothetical protein QNK05_12045 [Myxococcota bacterium]|nr:hypothetical protein [Myxococcota bacterium]
MKYSRFEDAAHDFGRSFTGTVNLASLDPTMTYLTRYAISSGEPVFRVDLLSGDAAPEPLNAPPVSESVRHYVRWFPRFIAQQGLAFRSIEAASLEVAFDLESVRDPELDGRSLSIDFGCTVRIEDDRGDSHVAAFRDTWHTKAQPPGSPRRFWWQFWRPAA